MVTFATILNKLNEKNIKYVIVGGLAVILHGYNRVTADIDLLLSLDEKNLEAMDKAMRELKYYPRIPVNVIELADHKRLERYQKEKNFKAYTFTSEGQPPINVDIIIEESLKFDSFYKRKKMFQFQTHFLPVISLPDLITMKKKANRDKDRLDASALMTFHLDV